MTIMSVKLLLRGAAHKDHMWFGLPDQLIGMRVAFVHAGRELRGVRDRPDIVAKHDILRGKSMPHDAQGIEMQDRVSIADLRQRDDQPWSENPRFRFLMRYAPCDASPLLR